MEQQQQLEFLRRRNARLQAENRRLKEKITDLENMRVSKNWTISHLRKVIREQQFPPLPVRPVKPSDFAPVPENDDPIEDFSD